MQAWCMSQRWGTRTVRMVSAACISQSMEERIGRGFSTWGKKSAFQILRCVLLPRSFCLLALGIRGALRGVRTLLLMGRAVAFTAQRMRAKPGFALRARG